MTLEEIVAVLEHDADDVEGDGGSWRFSLDGVQLACFTDERYDRMRVIAPIKEDDELTEEERSAMLEANFHTALDARYATSGGVLYAAFIHPLSPLSVDELRSAIRQVASLVQTFGSSYSGGTLVFGTAGGSGELN